MKSGQWELIGGMWVEADCNLTGAESFVRQLLLGRKFYLEEFEGVDSPVLWLPDVFGYSWQLPQIMKQAGIKYFVTAKLSWNQYNRIPYDTFWWKGLDGSKILTHFITTKKPGWWGATYSADLLPDEILDTWQGTQQKSINRKIILPFGQGDGGGGPNQGMIDRGRIMQKFPGLPKVKFTKVFNFLEEIEKGHGKELPDWNGELYLELHRGTYTTQAKNKYLNRKSEFLMHDIEFLATWASVVNEKYVYPREKLNHLWKLICLNQFHDIIPGSSIKKVYEDSLQDYQEVMATGLSIRDDAINSLEESYSIDGDWIVFNPTSFDRTEMVQLSEKPQQDRPASSDVLRIIKDIPAYGFTVIPDFGTREAGEVLNGQVYVGRIEGYQGLQTWPEASYILENSLMHLEFNQQGEIIRILDKEVNREVLDAGQKSNQWMLFEDRPLDWDAWDIDIFYDENFQVINHLDDIQITESGPLRGCLSVRRLF